MDRAAMVTHLATWYGDLLADAGLSADDTAGGLAGPLNEALRLLDVPSEDWAAAEPDDTDGFIALAEYQTLRRIVRALAVNIDVGLSGGESFKLKQAFDNAQQLLEQAKADVLALFGSLYGNTGGPRVGQIVWSDAVPERDEFEVVA